MKDTGYILAVYTIIWFVVFGFVLAGISRQSRLRREMERLKTSMGKKEGGG
jgi:CcmD family protein